MLMICLACEIDIRVDISFNFVFAGNNFKLRSEVVPYPTHWSKSEFL